MTDELIWKKAAEFLYFEMERERDENFTRREERFQYYRTVFAYGRDDCPAAGTARSRGRAWE
jgi:hypothetical protein